jgi:hypothetical protein
MSEWYRVVRDEYSPGSPARKNLPFSRLLKPVPYSLIRTGVIQYNCTSGILQKSLIT